MLDPKEVEMIDMGRSFTFGTGLMVAALSTASCSGKFVPAGSAGGFTLP